MEETSIIANFKNKSTINLNCWTDDIFKIVGLFSEQSMHYLHMQNWLISAVILFVDGQ